MWDDLLIKIDLESCLTRMVLFEKYSKKEGMTYFFISKLNGCKLFKHKEYPARRLFYVKNEEIIMIQDSKNKVFYIRYAGFWSVFESRYGLNYFEIQSFTKDMLEDNLKIQDFTTKYLLLPTGIKLEDTLKIQDFTTHEMGGVQLPALEDSIKLK